ncbi:molybdopterin molybdotransferase MoeA [Streptomyces sp. NPDC089799]|uniref:molybdopterin molybdotransferase MoeA n=1 Tax=Streptomyces sp. NPDC089799 TaxID=3155066 RepID=UPI003441891C
MSSATLTASAPTTPAPPSPAVPWARARQLAHAAARPVAARTVPLGAAAGLTLAEDLRALHPLPSFDTAAMDGYAVAAGPGPWRIRGAVRAGAAWDGVLGAGECVEISTGAPVPAGAWAVLPLETVERAEPAPRTGSHRSAGAGAGGFGSGSAGGGLVSGPVLPPGRHVRRAGEDAPAGSRLAPAGTRTGPALLGLAASCGHDTLPVRPRPRIGVLVTGDELDHAGLPGPGRVRDALGPLLPPLAAALGGECGPLRHVADRPAGRLAGAVHALREAEVVVVTGSTSVGVTDQLRRLLHDAGARMAVDTVACRPGHPMLLAELPSGRWVVGLPGNPYAALVAAHTLLGPLIAGLSGRPLDPLPQVPVRGRVRAAAGRTRLVPVVWEGAGARAVEGHGAAFLQGAAVGDAFAALPPGWTDGDPAPLVLLPGRP